MHTVKPSIELLKRAQQVDSELYHSQLRLSEIPQERLTINQDLELEKNHLRSLETSLKNLQLKQKQKEGELAQKEANVRKLDGQSSQVKTNKEYSALQQEISSLKADNSILEEEIIKILDEVEAAEEEVRKEKERLKLIENDFQAKETELAEKEKSFLEAVARLKKERGAILAQVAPDMRNLYDLIVQKKQGLGLVKINGESCGACQLQLRPQLINDVRLGSSLIVCENCSRILYFEE